MRIVNDGYGFGLIYFSHANKFEFRQELAFLPFRTCIIVLSKSSIYIGSRRLIFLLNQLLLLFLLSWPVILLTEALIEYLLIVCRRHHRLFRLDRQNVTERMKAGISGLLLFASGSCRHDRDDARISTVKECSLLAKRIKVQAFHAKPNLTVI